MEAEKLAAEKRAAEQLKAEKLAAEKLAAEEVQASPVASPVQAEASLGLSDDITQFITDIALKFASSSDNLQTEQDQVLYALFHHFASNGNAMNAASMSLNEFRAFLRELKVFGTKKDSFTSAKADILFLRFTSMEENEEAEAAARSSIPGHDRQLEFGEFKCVAAAVVEVVAPKTGMTGMVTKKFVPLLAKIVAEYAARKSSNPVTSTTAGLEQMPVVTKNGKQIDALYEYYCRAFNTHNRSGTSVKSTGLSFKGVAAMLRDFGLLTLFGTLSAAQELFFKVNQGAAISDVLTKTSFLVFLDHTSQVMAAKDGVELSDAFVGLLEKMEKSDGRTKVSSRNNGVMLRPFNTSGWGSVRENMSKLALGKALSSQKAKGGETTPRITARTNQAKASPLGKSPTLNASQPKRNTVPKLKASVMPEGAEPSPRTRKAAVPKFNTKVSPKSKKSTDEVVVMKKAAVPKFARRTEKTGDKPSGIPAPLSAR